MIRGWIDAEVQHIFGYGPRETVRTRDPVPWNDRRRREVLSNVHLRFEAQEAVYPEWFGAIGGGGGEGGEAGLRYDDTIGLQACFDAAFADLSEERPGPLPVVLNSNYDVRGGLDIDGARATGGIVLRGISGAATPDLRGASIALLGGGEVPRALLRLVGGVTGVIEQVTFEGGDPTAAGGVAAAYTVLWENDRVEPLGTHPGRIFTFRRCSFNGGSRAVVRVQTPRSVLGRPPPQPLTRVLFQECRLEKKGAERQGAALEGARRVVEVDAAESVSVQFHDCAGGITYPAEDRPGEPTAWLWAVGGRVLLNSFVIQSSLAEDSTAVAERADDRPDVLLEDPSLVRREYEGWDPLQYELHPSLTMLGVVSQSPMLLWRRMRDTLRDGALTRPVVLLGVAANNTLGAVAVRVPTVRWEGTPLDAPLVLSGCRFGGPVLVGRSLQSDVYLLGTTFRAGSELLGVFSEGALRPVRSWQLPRWAPGGGP
ncbi:MAG: hypothetical protein HY909_09270 [Deltaproteobacteria bacterium]|nr:hypothetical protein [Deltaproteobacteria bacterium]